MSRSPRKTASRVRICSISSPSRTDRTSPCSRFQSSIVRPDRDHVAQAQGAGMLDRGLELEVGEDDRDAGSASRRNVARSIVAGVTSPVIPLVTR